MIDTAFMTAEQTRHLKEVADTWLTYGPILQRKRQLVGGLQWKKVNGNEYLYRYQPDPITKQKRSTSVGRRSAETEALYDAFITGRDLLAADAARIEPDLDSQRRVSRALRLNRLPDDDARVLTTLWEDDLHHHLMVLGDVAVVAYENSFGRLITPNVPARRSAPDHEDGADEIAFIAPDDDEFIETMIASLRRIDRSYELIGNAITGDQGPRVWIYGREQMALAVNDLLQDVDVETFETLLDEPPVQAVAISRGGSPVPVAAIHPVAFAVLEMLEDKDEERAMKVASITLGKDIAGSGPSDLLEAVRFSEVSSPRI